MENQTHRTLLFICIIAAASFFAGFFTNRLAFPFTKTDNFSSIQDKYPLLSRRIDTYQEKDRMIHFVPLRQDIRAYLATQSGEFSFYFEYIPTGNSIGFNDQQTFAYASLLKVPLVMAVYKHLESGKILPTSLLTVTPDTLDYKYGNLWKQGVGTTITVQEAIKLILTESDNTAYQLLRTLVTPEQFAAVFDNLDIPLSINQGEPVVTTKNFTSILRSLYFSSILTEKSSQEILELLTQSTFKDGIRSPIPLSVPVAHKMGIREETDSLSDCGLVYLPNRPYFLCTVSINNTSSNATETIQMISRKVYNYLNQ